MADTSLTGQNGALKISSTTIAYVTDWEVTFNQATYEISALGDSVRSFTIGIRDFEASVTGIVSSSDASQSTLRQAVISGTNNGAVDNLRFYDDVDNATYYHADTATNADAELLIENYVETANFDGTIGFSCSIRGSHQVALVEG